jgi:tRNA(Ile2) C34 agmatinyltransferase TiaS
MEHWQIILIALGLTMLVFAVNVRPRVTRCRQCGQATEPAGLADGRCLSCRLPVESLDMTAARRALEQAARQRQAIARLMTPPRGTTPDADRLLHQYDQEVYGEK